MRPRTLFSLAAGLVGISQAAPQGSSPGTGKTREVKTPSGTVVGSVANNIEAFRGIPYAQPPVGSLRLRPPVRLESFGTFDATGLGPACPQNANAEPSELFFEVLSLPGVQETLFSGSALGNIREDCLTISVQRPANTAADAKLPVVYWIYGGGYQLGSEQPYDGTLLVSRAAQQGKPFILVTVNYRLGAFGFLGGKEILADGAANLGLLDQRMGLEWVADNIAAFGGDPSKVTLWGQSAGAMSVYSQMALYDGNNKYKGKALFRGAMMNSGSITPTEPVDGARAQEIFDQVAEAAGCGSSSDKVQCLRDVDFETLDRVSASTPSFLGWNSMALTWYPRPDGRILRDSPEALALKKKYAAVPLLIGNQKNEGTVFSVWQTNFTTKAELVTYLNNVFFRSASPAVVEGLVNTYSADCGNFCQDTYPEYQRLSTIIGDWSFTLMARLLLSTYPVTVPAYAYMGSYGSDTPIIGAHHVSDMPRMFGQTDVVSSALQDLYISFIHSLNPNGGTVHGGYASWWPKWQLTKQLLEFRDDSTGFVTDIFRTSSFQYIRKHVKELRM